MRNSSNAMHNNTPELIINSNIYEYDIRKANISVLYDKKLLSKDTYTKLYHADRMTRQVYIGKLQRDDKKYTEALQAGIKEARNIFIKNNNIKEDNIIRISNDAIYTTGVIIKNPKINNNIVFVNKGSYTTYIRINKYEIFYSYNIINKSKSYKVLGLTLKDGHNAFLNLLLEILYYIETSSLDIAYNMLLNIIDSYKNREFDKEYYISFDPNCCYMIGNYLCDDISENDKTLVDIEFNLNILYKIKQIINIHIL